MVHLVRAVVYATPMSGFSVGGIPLLARTILTLWTAGVRVFTVIGADPESADFQSARRHIVRVAGDAEVHWVGANGDDPEGDSAARVISIVADGVFAAPLATRLITRGRLGNVFMTLPGSDHGLWMLNAADQAARLADRELAFDSLHARSGDYFPVRERNDIASAERGLFGWCIKQTDGVVSRYFNRPISTWISRYLSHYDIEPRQLTVVTALLAIATFASLLIGTLPGLVAGCVLYHVTSVVDGLDGEIARAKYMATRAGAALDTGVDMASNLLFMIGISIGCAEVFGDEYAWMGMFIGVTVVASITVMVMALRFGPGGGSFDVLQLTIQQRLLGRPRLTRLFQVVNAGFKRDLFAFVFAILGLANVPEMIPWLLTFGSIAWLVTILVNTPAMLRANRDEVLPAHLKPARAAITTPAHAAQG